jgi:hypothetical protein
LISISCTYSPHVHGKTRPRAAAKIWVATTNFPTAASRPFYTRLNQRLAEHYFDAFVEGQWQPSYAEIMVGPGLPPGMYFRRLLICYFIQRQAAAVCTLLSLLWLGIAATLTTEADKVQQHPLQST